MSHLAAETVGHVRVLRLDRPERKNALTASLGWSIVRAMAEAHDMRPSGGVGEWTCSECGRHENVIESPALVPTEQSATDLERWENEGGSPLDAGLR